jgi:hypothetical protein
MMDADRSVTSADQDAWLEIARALRGQLVKRIEQQSSLSMGDIAVVTNIAHNLMNLEICAETYDNAISRMGINSSYG